MRWGHGPRRPSDPALPRGACHDGGLGLPTELRADVGHVPVGGVDTEVRACCDLRVAQPVRSEPEDVALALREPSSLARVLSDTRACRLGPSRLIRAEIGEGSVGGGKLGVAPLGSPSASGTMPRSMRPRARSKGASVRTNRSAASSSATCASGRSERAARTSLDRDRSTVRHRQPSEPRTLEHVSERQDLVQPALPEAQCAQPRQRLVAERRRRARAQLARLHQRAVSASAQRPSWISTEP